MVYLIYGKRTYYGWDKKELPKVNLPSFPRKVDTMNEKYGFIKMLVFVYGMSLICFVIGLIVSIPISLFLAYIFR